jgi:hypothetical protein
MSERKVWGIVIVTLVACRSTESKGPLMIDARIRGEHCISADPLAYYFLREKTHTEAEIRKQKAFARTIGPMRFTIERTGAIRVTAIDGRTRTGTVVAAHDFEPGELVGTGMNGGQSLTIRWQGEPPPPPVLSKTTANFYWSKEGTLLEGTDDVAVELVRRGNPMCVDADVAWLRDPTTPPTPPPTSTVAPAAWATMDATKWPQIVLTNAASFHDATPLDGASSFLVDDRSRIVLATALHLIGDDGGVRPAVSLASFDHQLESWSAFVRTRPEPSVRATALAMTPVKDADAADWLLLKTEPAAPPPATPLQLRDTPVALGERISLIGCEYKDRTCTQRVIGGRVTARSGSSFRYELDRPIELPGFSGAPIVDASGRVVGVMSVWFTPFTIGLAYLEGGGQDATVARKLLLP